MHGVAPLLHIPDAVVQRLQQAPVQVGMDRPAQVLPPGKIPAGLDIIRQIDDFFQLGHVGVAGGVPVDGAIDRVIHGEHVPGDGCAGFGVQQLQGVLLQVVQLDVILSAQGQLLIHVQLLGAVVKQSGDPGLVSSAPYCRARRTASCSVPST